MKLPYFLVGLAVFALMASHGNLMNKNSWLRACIALDTAEEIRSCAY